MKGFGIEIKNEVLDPKHVKNMGHAVWLYMWLIDKITSVTEEGIGRVLGGKPIKYEEVKLELGISRRTYVRWVEVLARYPYIETTNAPYGIIFRVKKAYKRFGNKERGAPHLVRGVPQTAHHPPRGAPQPHNLIKTVTRRDNTKDRDFSFEKSGMKKIDHQEFLKRFAK